MKDKRKIYIITLLALMVLAFGLIFMAVGLTGERELSEFTARDWRVFIGFIVSEVTDLIIMFIVALRLGRMNRAAAAEQNKAPSQPSADGSRPVEKLLKRRGALLVILSCILSCASVFLGGVLPTDGSAFLLYFFMAVPALIVLTTVLVRMLIQRKYAHMNIAELQSRLLSSREDAEKTAGEKLRLLKALRSLGDICAALLFICGVGLTAMMVTVKASLTLLVLLSIALLLTALTRIRYPVPKKLAESVDTLVPREEIPHIYEMAERARDEMGCSGDVLICVQGGSNVGIYSFSRVYSIELGVQVLSLWAESELYAVLLHEFAHFGKGSSEAAVREDMIMNRLNGSTPQHFLRFVYDFIFSVFDVMYNYEYSLYSYAISVSNESNADRAMLKAGKEAAASALLKLSYCNLYNYETVYESAEPLYASATPPTDAMRRENARLAEAIGRRGELWDGLIKKEILARSASHPTTVMRLQEMGVETFHALPREEGTEFSQEVGRCIGAWDRLISANPEFYAQSRKEYYLEPMNTVNRWVRAGKPLIAEDYRDVLDALQRLGDTDEMLALCERAISELPDSASPEAYMRKGLILLHRFDESGIEYIYHALEANHNYVEKGLSEIGSFCCLTGNSEKLEEYRERALIYAQQDMDGADEVGYLKKGDCLSAETLPEGVLERDLARIASIDPHGSIYEVYLVHKAVNESVYSSVYVIRFCQGVSDDERYGIMHGIFNYLDTVSHWQYSLFDYEDVRDARVERIDGALVYRKNEGE